MEDGCGNHHESGLHEAVLATVAWFDMFGYPLTLPEIGRFMPVELRVSGASLSDIAAILESPEFVCMDGHYAIAGGTGDTALRHHRYRLAKSKLERARRAARLFGLLPSVRLVAACNNLAVSNAEEASDIDLFIVCRSGTLWLTRFVLAGALKALGLRPTPEDQKDKLCLSFWISESRMDISRFALPDSDPYMDFWMATLLPLYDAGGVFEQFRKINGGGRPEDGRRDRPGRLERLAKRVQMRKFPQRIRNMANLDSRVVISDDVLKFHVNDRREAYRDRFRERLESLTTRL